MYKLLSIMIIFCCSLFGAEPYLWQTNASGFIENNLELKSSTGISFSGGGHANSVAIGSKGDVYIVGYGNLGTQLPYLWIYTNGAIQNGIELKSSSGNSFTSTSLAANVAIAFNGDVYIVGSGSLGSSRPYLWIYTNGAIQNGIELKSSSGTSFTNGSSAVNVVIDSNGDVYIAGSGSLGSPRPYLWIYTNGSIENGIELKSSSGIAFTGRSSALNIALTFDGEIYIVGYGNPGGGCSLTFGFIQMALYKMGLS